MTGPELIEAARQLLEREGGREDVPAGVGAASALACDALVARLGDVVGRAGARALYERALTLTMREHPCLAACLPSAGPTPAVSLRSCLDANPGAAWPASISLITGVVSLFATFVGWSLATRILRQYRPEAFPSRPTEDTQ